MAENNISNETNNVIQQEEKKKGLNSFFICEILIILAAPLFSLVIMLIQKSTLTGIIRCEVSLLLLSGILALILLRAVRARELLYDNLVNINRFMMSYVVCALIAALSSLVPELLIPLAAMSLICAVLSNTYTGIVCGLIFCTEPLLLSEKSFEYFLFTFAVSMMIILLILAGRDIKEKTAEPLIIFSFVYITLYTALIVLKREEINPAVIINPLVGLVLNDVIICLTIYSVRKNIILANEEKYEKIVDPEHPLLIRLKRTNTREYKRSIHTAYICDRLSDRLGFNRVLMKGAGFYHRIGVLSEDNKDVAKATVSMVKKEGFPWPLVKILEQYGNDKSEQISPEASLICIADTLINEILLRMEKGEEDIDYDKLIDRIINALIGSRNGKLQKSDLKIQHLYRIRKYLKEEKLYYDFLR